MPLNYLNHDMLVFSDVDVLPEDGKKEEKCLLKMCFPLKAYVHFHL